MDAQGGHHRGDAYGRWVVRNRWPILVLTAMISVAVASGAVRLKVNDDYRVFFEPGDPELLAYEALQNVFSKNEYVMFTVAPRRGDVFEPGVLASIQDITDEAWKLAYTMRVDSLVNYPYSRAAGDELIVEELAGDWENKTPEQLDVIKAIVVEEPGVVHALVSPSAHVAGVVVTYQLPDLAPNEGTDAALAARALAERVSSEHPEIDIYVTGTLMLNNAFREAAEHDIGTLIPLMYVGMLVLMLFLFRSIWCTIATMAVLSLSVAAAMGLAGFLGFDITATSASAPNIIMTIAVADSVHLIMALLERMRRGTDRREALVESVRENLLPVFLTSFTTLIGFLSINFSDSPPFRDLGNMCAMGIVAAYVYSVLFLPAFLAVVPFRGRVRHLHSAGVMTLLASAVVKRPRFALSVAIVVVAALAAFIPLNELNDHYTMYFDESNGFRQDIEFTTANLTGMYPIEYAIGSDGEGGVADPEYLATLDSFTKWFRDQPDVVHVSSFSDVMKRINMNMHGDDPSEYALPDNRELAAQYLLLYEMSLPFGLDLNNRVDVRKSASRFVVTVGGVTSNAVVENAEAGSRWLRENAPPTMYAQGLGPSVLFSKVAQRDTRNMLVGTAIALVLVSAIFLLFLGDVRLGLISLVPNLVPAIVGFGLWGLLVGRIGLGLAAVIAMTLGLVVDDTIHFLTQYSEARRRHGRDRMQAIHHALSTVGNALVATSIILVGGFMVLSFSTFEVNAAMGRMTALIIAIALVCEFAVLPPLLVLFDRSAPEVKEVST